MTTILKGLKQESFAIEPVKKLCLSLSKRMVNNIVVTVTHTHKERQFVTLSLSKSMSLSSLTYRITPNRFIVS